MKLWMKRVANGLYPDGADFMALFDELPRGTALRVEITKPRNPQFAKLYWTLCARIAKGIGRDQEWVSNAFKVETGHYQIFTTIGRREVLQLDSIAFDKMDELRFREFFNQCVTVLYQKWGIDPSDVADMLLPKGTENLITRQQEPKQIEYHPGSDDETEEPR
jgi:hypothetical protein